MDDQNEFFSLYGEGRVYAKQRQRDERRFRFLFAPPMNLANRASS